MTVDQNKLFTKGTLLMNLTVYLKVDYYSI